MVEPDMQKKASGGSGGSEMDTLNATSNSSKQGVSNNKRNPVSKKKPGNKVSDGRDYAHNYHGKAAEKVANNRGQERPIRRLVLGSMIKI